MAELDLAQVQAIKARHERRLLALPKVVAVGVGLTTPFGPQRKRRPAIVISVSEHDPLRDDIPAEIEGAPVLVKATGVFRRV
jgi:hypothetical protein